MLMGAVACYLRTGKMPEKLDDYIHIPDANGKNRMYMKNYISDEMSFLRRPGETTVHKSNYAIQTAYELFWVNADYYGREIQHPGDSPGKKAKNIGTYLMHSLTPFALQNYQDADRRGMSLASKTAAAFGYLPSPKWVGLSPAESLASELAANTYQNGPRTSADVDRQQEVLSLSKKYDQKAVTIPDIIKEVRASKIRESDAEHIVRTTGTSDLVKSVDRLRVKDALNVWDLATPEEQKQIFPSLIRKYRQVYTDYEPEEQTVLQTKLRSILDAQARQKPRPENRR
jgi:hypothetical protein